MFFYELTGLDINCVLKTTIYKISQTSYTKLLDRTQTKFKFKLHLPTVKITLEFIQV